ncbi:MAG: helix-turn-helix domain-containing protein [Candidatus Omnitrophota bacterium]|jgi:transcriptional regulator with XRE-family HTH domain
MKTIEKEKAIQLRKELGLSINKIAKQLNVSKSSVSLWVRGIVITDEQKLKLKHNQKSKNLLGNTYSHDKYQLIRKQYQLLGKIKTQEKNLLHVAGCMLYWGEGSKNKNSVYFTNSDPNMILFFKKFLMDCYNVPIEKMTLTVNCYDNVYNKETIEKYWLNILNLNQTNLRKTTLNSYSKYSSKKKIGKLPYGTVRLNVNDTKLVQNIYGAIQEYGNFTNDKWLG